jgi:hypothetical protein
MGVRVYLTQTSVPQGGVLDLHLADDTGAGADATVTITDVIGGTAMLTVPVHVDPHPVPADPAADHGWPRGAQVDIAADWPSAVYAVDVSPSNNPDRDRALFVVRAADPGHDAPILVAVPFPTYHAYAWMGETPGASVYWNEQPDRARRVSLRRPSPMTMQWEEPILRWLSDSGRPVEYCSGYDLEDGRDLLGNYRLLVCIGHDEYWSVGMRDAVEEFVGSGGNVAFLTGNTCWWQFRLEDGGATFVCYRDAIEDPLAGVRNDLVTVEWGSAPVGRPENSLLGVSFRHGAGCWNDLTAIADEVWTTRFSDHWVFEGTGLADGAPFGRGTVGYETDAAEVVEELGIPRVTGRDGTPPEFVVLATVDLGHWRSLGQGGSGTIGVFRSPGGGTVFNAATTGWGAGLHPTPDPVVERITGNVLDRLQRVGSNRDWEVIGRAEDVTGMVTCENTLFAADRGGVLWRRDPVPQNLLWTQAGSAADVRALASPREAGGGAPIGLYALTTAGQLLQQAPVVGAAWTIRRSAPGLIALAMSFQSFFAVTAADDLAAVPITDSTASWVSVGDGGGVRTMTNLNGRLFGASADSLLTRRPVLGPGAWERLAELPGSPAALAGHAGRLYLATTDGFLYRRDTVF